MINFLFNDIVKNQNFNKLTRDKTKRKIDSVEYGITENS